MSSVLRFDLRELWAVLFLAGCGRLQRIAGFAPAIQAALQRPNSFHALLSQEQRHTGASSFVWSSAEKDDFAVRGQSVALFL